MSRQEILDKLAVSSEELRQFGVKSISLFGSAARDEPQPHNDIDLLVEFDDRPVGLFELSRLQRRLQQILGVTHLDLVTREGLHPALRQRVLSEAIRAA